jgi:YggT family protein
LIWVYIYVLIAAAVMSWLIAFNVVNRSNHTVRMIWAFLVRVTEPGLRPIRAILPNLGGIDISPVILIIGLMFLDQFIVWAYVSLFA